MQLQDVVPEAGAISLRTLPGAAGTVGFAHTGLGLRTSLVVQYMPQEQLPILKEFPQAVGADLTAMGHNPK